MSCAQPGILAPPAPLARYLSFDLKPETPVRQTLSQLAGLVDGLDTVAGIGTPLVERLGKAVPGLQTFPDFSSKYVPVPATQAALWLWLRGGERGELFHRARQLQQTLAPAFALTGVVDAFIHKDSRDLTGYEDGTENPQGDAAEAAAIAADGSSFVAVQQWQHDFEAFGALSQAQKDDIIGRRLADNEEFDEAPVSAHVKRTAQESFEPEAFVLRRSMPWVADNRAGLMCVACGHTFDAFAAQMRRMSGAEDGVVDGLFSISQPLGGAYYWCPPLLSTGGQLDLSTLI